MMLDEHDNQKKYALGYLPRDKSRESNGINI